MENRRTVKFAVDETQPPVSKQETYLGEKKVLESPPSEALVTAEGRAKTI